MENNWFIKLLCKLGLHKMDENWCMRKGCSYHLRYWR